MEKQEKRETLKELEDWRQYYFNKWKQTKREFYKAKTWEYEGKVLKLLPGYTYTREGVLVEDKNSNEAFTGLLSEIRRQDFYERKGVNGPVKT